MYFPLSLKLSLDKLQSLGEYDWGAYHRFLFLTSHREIKLSLSDFPPYVNLLKVDFLQYSTENTRVVNIYLLKYDLALLQFQDCQCVRPFLIFFVQVELKKGLPMLNIFDPPLANSD